MNDHYRLQTGVCFLQHSRLNEKKEYMQKTQHTQQTAAETAQNQDIDITWIYKNTGDLHKQETNIY